WSATGVVFSGIALDVYMKQTSKKSASRTVSLDEKPTDKHETIESQLLGTPDKLAKVDVVLTAELQLSTEQKIDRKPSTRHELRRRQQLVEVAAS
ncbi:hypothetical protein LPJ60_006370, partial [Coemansia sp. RSA 2675]